MQAEKLSAIGIDLGGTNIKGALYEEGEKKDQIEWPTGDRSFAKVADRMVEVLDHLKKSATHPIQGIGVGVPGGVLQDRSTIHRSPNFPDWLDVDLGAAFKQRGVSNVVIENDANCAALAESVLGVGRPEADAKPSDMALFTLGTGVGGGIVLAGKIQRGAWGMAGELGHITVQPDGPVCGCGSLGCLEQYASGTAIIRAAQAAFHQHPEGFLSRPTTAREVFDLAEQGQSDCQQAFVQAGKALGIAISMLVNALNLPLFVIGGGVGAALPRMQTAIMDEIRTRTFPYAAERVLVCKAKLGNEAGTAGAALSACQS